MSRDMCSTTEEVNRSCSLQKSLWLTSHRSPNFFVHPFLQRAKRKANEYLLFCALGGDFIPIDICSLHLWKLLCPHCVPSKG